MENTDGRPSAQKYVPPHMLRTPVQIQPQQQQPPQQHFPAPTHSGSAPVAHQQAPEGRYATTPAAFSSMNNRWGRGQPSQPRGGYHDTHPSAGAGRGNFSDRFQSGGRGGSGGAGGNRWGSHTVDDAEVEALFHAQVQSGINFDKYDDIPVEVSGTGKVAPIDAFDAIKPIHPLLLANIQRANYSRPTPVQKHAIPIVLGGRDLMACAQTGSGKTAAFLFPVINRLLFNGPSSPPEQTHYGRPKAYPNVLILAPTRELSTQIYDEARKFCYQSKLRCVVVYGGAEVKSQLQQLDRGCDILVATPGRLQDLMERGRISLGLVSFLVLDEADRMLDMGFEKQIRHIVCESDMPYPPQRQTLMYSATFPKAIQQLASEFLLNYLFLTVGRVGSTTEFITQRLEWVEERDKRQFLLSLLSQQQGLTLVFVETKREADTLENFLASQGLPATSIHGDRTQKEREDALRSFKTGRTPYLVATDVASRGLDIPNVAHVIQYDLTTNKEDYVHRIGRTGRAGNTGLATAFFNEKNRGIATDLLELLREHNQEVPPFLMSMASHMPSGGRSQGRPRGGKSFGSRDFRQHGGGGRGGGGGGSSGGHGASHGGGGGGGGGSGGGSGQRFPSNFLYAYASSNHGGNYGSSSWGH
eukprot:TRINITY_DN575_c0_g1_i1.p1 TRINITY_DN575_c0_g1~~TRINITY_DN575_c0_g1_i1.p1  ORF type:complete len:642 (-),score=73.72 TRINITY_DN575_c0_g1_i1:363-2288(-)